MASMIAGWRTRAGFVIALVTGSGCVAPQLDALKRSLESDPRELVRAYEACRARVEAPSGLDECMGAAGYRFLSAVDQDYRASECWDDRYHGRYPQAYCYVPDKAAEK